MKVIGLAGPAGSGKTTVAQELSKQEGIVAIDLDKVAWETYRVRTSTYWRLVWRFGREILDAQGTIDRTRLGAVVFSDARALSDLNAIVHPAVIEQLRKIIEEEKKKGTRVLLVEGALLASSPHVDTSVFDAIIWLQALEQTRRDRLKATGRHIHIERTVPQPPSQDVIIIDAEGTIADVVARIAHAIEGN